MAITAIKRDFSDEPNIVRIISSDSLATVSAANYILGQAANIAAINAGPFEWNISDFVLVYASDGWGFFSISADFKSLTPFALSTTIVGAPVTIGDFAIFQSVSGNLEDLGYSPSDASKAKVVMANGAVSIDNIAVYVDTAGTIGENRPNALNSTSTSSATPGTIRSIIGSITGSNATMTSGNLVGVRGIVNAVGASGGFLYGTQGKIVSTGTLSGSVWAPAVFGQLDVSAATINGGQVAALWGDWGATGAVASDMSGTSGIKFTNTTANKLNEQINTYGDATYYLNIRGNPGPLSYYLAAGTSAGSAGDAAHCAAQQVLKIVVQGSAAYIPVFTQNS